MAVRVFGVAELQQGDVGLLIAADQLGVQFAPVVQLHADFIGVVDDVIVGQHVAFGGVDDDAGTQPFKWAGALLLAGEIGAEEASELFRQLLTLHLGACDMHAHYGGQDFFQHRRQARQRLPLNGNGQRRVGHRYGAERQAEAHCQCTKN